MHELIRALEAQQLKADPPKFKVGDTVRVHAKIVEGKHHRR